MRISQIFNFYTNQKLSFSFCKYFSPFQSIVFSISEPLLVVRILCRWVAFPLLFYFEKLNIIEKLKECILFIPFTQFHGSLTFWCSLLLILTEMKFTYHDTLSPNNYVCLQNKDILLYNRDIIFIPKKLIYNVVP